MTAYKNLEDVDEEFNNFLNRVNNINDIVKKLASNDKTLQEIGTLEADQYLKCNDELNETAVIENLELKVKSNRTVFNKKALHRDDKDQDTMSQESFMDEVSRDADKRYKDKLVRIEKSETFKTRATKAFRRGEFEQALSSYIKAIEQIKDSPQLYLNRALCQIKLERFNYAIEDCRTALQLNEDSLKAWLLLAKCYFLTNNKKEFNEAVKEAKKRNKNQMAFIDEYITELQGNK